MSISRVALVAVGVVSILMSLLGFRYNSHTIGADFSTVLQQFDVPYSYHALYIMSAICLVYYFLLLNIGVRFIRGRTNMVRLFAPVLLGEFLYFIVVGVLCRIPVYGMSIGAALGVANGGLMFQAFVFLSAMDARSRIRCVSKCKPHQRRAI